VKYTKKIFISSYFSMKIKNELEMDEKRTSNILKISPPVILF
jgi:hypothetical protein